MTSNLKITRDLPVGGGRVGWPKRRTATARPARQSYKNKSVQRRMKRMARQREEKRADVDILSFYAFPPSTPRNTTQFLINRLENEQPANTQPMDSFTFSYGSMDGLMDLSTLQSCRMDATSESLDCNTHKFHHLELTN